MDLRSQLVTRKKYLKATRTFVTNELGERYEVVNGIARKLNDKCLPFVVDEKPDMQIAAIVEGLFVSSQDPLTSEELLKFHCISHVLSLGIEPSLKYKEIYYHFVNFLDIPEFDISNALKECFRIIESCKGDNILVHCNAGVSRSATVVIAYLMASEGLAYDKAYERVRTIRNCVRPNDGFVRQIKNFNNLKDMLSTSVTDTINKT